MNGNSALHRLKKLSQVCVFVRKSLQKAIGKNCSGKNILCHSTAHAQREFCWYWVEIEYEIISLSQFDYYCGWSKSSKNCILDYNFFRTLPFYSNFIFLLLKLWIIYTNNVDWEESKPDLTHSSLRTEYFMPHSVLTLSKRTVTGCT